MSVAGDAGFSVPDAARGATDLTAPTLNKATAIQPNERVLCINRGRQTLIDTFDGRHIPLPVGYFEIEFDAAQHFQRRLIVPGTRNLAENAFVSYIGILGTTDGRIRRDTDEYCTPFTDEQLQTFGERVEGLDRSGLDEVTPQRVSAIIASTMRSTGPGGRRGVQVFAGESAEAQDAAAHVLDRPEESATREAEVEAAADGIAPVPRRRRR